MTEQLNKECIRKHENHDVRIEACEKDITNLGISLRSEMKNLWNKLDKYVYVIIGTGIFQVIAIIVAVYLKK
jgi:hypothetical protein